MSYIPLTNEKSRVILAGETVSNLHSLDANGQRGVLNRLLTVIDNAAPPSSFVRERIANLDIIHEGGQCRLYTKVVENIPRGNTQYHIVYVFYIDATHDYPHSALATYSTAAQARMEEATTLETVSDVEQYLAGHDALSPDDLREMLTR